jgi:hypothetical protein
LLLRNSSSCQCEWIFCILQLAMLFELPITGLDWLTSFASSFWF